MKTSDEILQDVNDLLDNYEKGIGLPEAIVENSEAKEFLGMTTHELRALSVEECAEAAIVLSNLAFNVQRFLNKENSTLAVADSILNKTISGKETQFKGSWTSQYHQAIKNDEYLSKWLRVKNLASFRIARLTFMSNSINKVADMYTNLARVKGKNG